MRGKYFGWYGRGVAVYRGLQDLAEASRAQLRRIKRGKKKDGKRV